MSAACRFGALRRFVAAGAAVALVPVAGAGLAVASAPAASAQGIGAECAAITEASAGWGIKESFRRYLKTIAIPDGGWDLDGVGFHGGETTADGAFDFHAKPAPESHIDGEDADIPLSGSIVLHGHANLLRIELTAMSVKVRGS